LTARGLHAAARVAAATGCGVWIETLPARQERGCHLPAFPALPYFPGPACAALADVAHLVLAGARDPVAFFGYPDQPSRFAPVGTTPLILADPDQGDDATLALEALAQELAAPPVTLPPRTRRAFASSGQPLTPDDLCRTLAALLPDHAIVVNEGLTTGFVWSTGHAANAAPHTMLSVTGGAIGMGLPNALGAALACPDRRVVALQADGSGLYTPQSLWSMAREGADVTIVVCANHRYRILQTELANAGILEPGPKAQSLTDLSPPRIDWTSLARGFGVPACRVRTDGELADALRRGFAEPGPGLIEAVLD
jgi:acetolactate synthase-1/2/3 large subunit